MGTLTLAGLLFIATHLGIASTALRGVLVRGLTERGYFALYSLIALATLGYLIAAYQGSGQRAFLWTPGPVLRGIALIAMPVAFVFLVGAFTARNPTAIGQAGTIGHGATGMIRVTRHPFQWAVVIWAVTHVLTNGDAASLVFFGSIGAVSLVGAFLIDHKKARRLGAEWSAFAAATSNLPFAAIAAGRNRMAWRELAVPLAVGLLVYALVLWQHVWVSGVTLI